MIKVTTISFVVRVSALAVNFISTVILARVLGASNYGSLVFSLSLISVAAIPASLGLPTLAIRKIPVLINLKHYRELMGFVVQSHVYIFISTIVLLFVLNIFGLVKLIAFKYTDLIWIFAAIYFSAILLFHSGISKGFERVTLGQIQELLLRPLFIVLVAFFGIKFTNNDEISTAELIGFGTFIAGLFSASLLLYNFKPRFKVYKKIKYKKYLQQSIPLMFTTAFLVLNRHLDVLMIGVLLNDKMAGIYQVSARAAELVGLILTVFNMVFAPKIALWYANDKLHEIQKFAILSTKIVLVLSLSLALVFVIFGQQFLILLYGIDYAEGKNALSILSISTAFSAVFGSVAVILNMCGRERVVAVVTMVIGSFNIISNYILILHYGIEGAAIATGFNLILWHVILAFYLKRELKIRSSFLM